MATCSLSQAGVVFSDVQTPTGVSGAAVVSEVFDHYEEGTWDPVWDTTLPTQSYAGQTGGYVKIGKQVFLNWYIQGRSHASSSIGGNLKIKGIPFTFTDDVDGGGNAVGVWTIHQKPWINDRRAPRMATDGIAWLGAVSTGASWGYAQAQDVISNNEDFLCTGSINFGSNQ